MKKKPEAKPIDRRNSKNPGKKQFTAPPDKMVSPAGRKNRPVDRTDFADDKTARPAGRTRFSKDEPGPPPNGPKTPRANRTKTLRSETGPNAPHPDRPAASYWERSRAAGHDERDQGNGTVELPGKHPVIEALKAGRKCRAVVFYEKIARNPRVEEIEKLARDAGIPVRRAAREHFEEKFPHVNHQNVYAVVDAIKPLDVEELIEACFARSDNPFVIAVRDIQYPQNMGAIIRTAECAGADGVLIPRHRSADLGYSVSKISAGAIEYLAMAETANLVEALKKMKKAGFWVAGASMAGTARYDETDFSSPTVLVIGGEEKGLGPLVERECDFLVKIPLLGHISSLNASVAAGLLIYEVARKRGFVSRVAPGQD